MGISYATIYATIPLLVATEVIETTTEEIEKAAWNGKDISAQTLEFIEYVYWLGLTYIYRMYRESLMDKNTAMQKKKILQNCYSGFALNREIYRRHRAIEEAFGEYRKELETCGCKHCKKMLRLIDGRELPDCYFDSAE